MGSPVAVLEPAMLGPSDHTAAVGPAPTVPHWGWERFYFQPGGCAIRSTFISFIGGNKGRARGQSFLLCGYGAEARREAAKGSVPVVVEGLYPLVQ